MKKTRKDPVAVALGRRRWQGKTRRERQAAARAAAQARWARRRRRQS